MAGQEPWVNPDLVRFLQEARQAGNQVTLIVGDGYFLVKGFQSSDPGPYTAKLDSTHVDLASVVAWR